MQARNLNRTEVGIIIATSVAVTLGLSPLIHQVGRWLSLSFLAATIVFALVWLAKLLLQKGVIK